MTRRWPGAAIATGLVLVVVAVAIVVAVKDGPSPSAAATPPANRFDADRAMRLAELQVGYGQRTAGSARLRRLARKLRPLLPNGTFEPVPGRGLRNIVGTIPGTKPGIVLGAHYDVLVKPRGFVGANNGAAGSAIVIEAARALARMKRPPGAPELRFVLFDGEEPARGTPEEAADFYSVGLRGSRAYVAAHPGRTRAMVLLDYVGHKGLKLPREATSTPALWSELRSAAKDTGNGWAFPNAIGPAITDDHTPFLRENVPAVDLIDWDYPGHELTDTLDKLSTRSLDAVGESVVELLRGQSTS
jgi:Zn-dependent M28 family amino/carboxypeptidase